MTTSWSFPKNSPTTPQAVPQAVPQAAPYSGAPIPGPTKRNLADQFLDVKPSDRDMITPGHYVVQVTEPYDSFLSKKDNRPVHKARFRVFWTQDGKTMGDTSVIWKENMHPEYARGDVKAYMCGVIGVPEPTSEQLNGFDQAAGQYVGVRVRENDKGFNDYKWYHIPAEGQAAIGQGLANDDVLGSIFR